MSDARQTQLLWFFLHARRAAGQRMDQLMYYADVRINDILTNFENMAEKLTGELEHGDESAQVVAAIKATKEEAKNTMARQREYLTRRS